MPHDGIIQLQNYTKLKRKKKQKNSAYLPECPPNVKTHCVQPKESSQKEEMHANS